MVIDHAIYQTWYNGIKESNPVKRRDKTIETIKQYYAFVLNGIDVRYASIQEPDLQIDVTFAGILIFDDDNDSYLSPSSLLPGDLVESSDALETFRQWVLSNMTSLPPSDHVMLFTGFNLTYGGSTSNAGLAYLRSICNSEYFFSIVEEYFEFRVISIAAHELGHSLGARHDMDENTCLSFQLYIMTSRFKFPSKSKAANPYRFSKCSIQYFKDFIFSLKRHGSYCLKTRDALQDIKEISGFLINQPGEIYTSDIQCQNSQGDRSYVCREKHRGDFSSTCSQGMLCYNTDIGMCSKILPADGTPCAKTKWCINGTCVEEMSVNRLADDCPFGDIPVVVRDNQTCRHLVSSAPWECYDERFRLNCCDSCFYKHTTVAGCEFGDRQSNCIKEACNDFNETTRTSECCETCSDVPFPTRPARTTTTTIATTTTMTTTAMPNTTTLATRTLQTTPTSANQVATLINPNLGIAQNSVPPLTTPATKTVTSKINPVTTLYDIGGVTFKSKNPDSSVLPNPETDTQNYITKENVPVITRNITPSSGVTRKNRHNNPPGIPPDASRDSPQELSGTTMSFITQNEKPGVEQPSPTVTDPPRRYIKNHGTGDDSGPLSTTDKSNEIHYISKPDVITSSHNTLHNSETNMDMTTTMSSILNKPITNSNMQPIWPPFINRYLTTRHILRKKISRGSNHGYRFDKPGGESDEDGNSSGGTSEEDSNGNGHGSWRQRFFHHLRTKINQHQERKKTKSKNFYENKLFSNLNLQHLKRF
ncbi:uncharacterized protein LOC126808770 [Patella vulgata]|uniref:uncharacterized protein LOC126808770 n=1 Tax=Patella vulgata TaxID=6465 RepID=UPI0024A7FF3A|nr:uncharacterized protein LOC126808770 [Patella vulgata]